jgi:deferrochelatase/peroxidase EfeB
LWNAISPGKRPAGLHPFIAIESNGRRAPSTGGDVLVHILSKRHDLNFELATQIRTQLDIPEKMLKRMIGTSGDGLYDHLLDFSQAVSGANFFAPSLEVLKSLVRR